MNNVLKSLILTSLFLVAPALINIVFSQPPPPPPPPCWNPPCIIPLDGGISFLIVAGIAYGGKRMYDARKKNID